MGEGKCASLLDWIIPGIAFLRASLIFHSLSFCLICPKSTSEVLLYATVMWRSVLWIICCLIVTYTIRTPNSVMTLSGFFVVNVQVIGIGMMLLVLHHDELNKFLDPVPEISDAATCILLVMSIVIITTSTAACICAVKSQTVLLCLYGGFLMCIALVELGLVISLVSNKDVLLANLDKGLNQTLINYQTNPKIYDGMDFLQSLFSCCGVYNYNDWKYLEPTEIPKSCCYIDISQCITTNPQHLHSQGCFLALQQLIREHYDVIQIGVLAVCLHPVVGSFISYSLVYRIKKKYYVV